MSYFRSGQRARAMRQCFPSLDLLARFRTAPPVPAQLEQTIAKTKPNSTGACANRRGWMVWKNPLPFCKKSSTLRPATNQCSRPVLRSQTARNTLRCHYAFLAPSQCTKTENSSATAAVVRFPQLRGFCERFQGRVGPRRSFSTRRYQFVGERRCGTMDDFLHRTFDRGAS